MRNFCYKSSLVLILFFVNQTQAVQDPLPSWKDGGSKKAIIEFVQCVTDKKNHDYVPPEDRFVTIDNDGTLWVEQPMYAQKVFMHDSAKELAEKQPSQYKNAQIMKGKNITKPDPYAVVDKEIVVEEYKNVVKQWFAKALHPRFKRHYTELVYQPMLEMMDYLRANQFQVYIVSGAGQDFIRSYADRVYGVKSNYVIGSTSKTDYVYLGKKPYLIKLREMLLVDDKEGKPEAINLFIGKKPLIAFGNSDGDRQMLEWTQSGPGKRLMFLVHHDDPNREYSYDAQSKIGHFSQDLMQEAQKNHWHVISMKNDWKVIFPFENKSSL